MKKIISILAFLIPTIVFAAEHPIENNKKALHLIQQSLEAHGGTNIENILRLSMTISSNFVNEGQSLHPLAPFESYPMRIDLKIDQPRKRMNIRASYAIAGDFQFVSQTILNDGKGFILDPVQKTYQETQSDPWVLNRMFPHRILQEALKNPASLRLNSPDSVVYANAEGQVFTLSIDPATSFLGKIDQVLPMGIYGDGSQEWEFLDYVKINSVSLPKKIILRNRNAVHTLVENTYRCDNMNANVSFTPEELKIPEGYRKANYSDRPPNKLWKLATDTYLFQNVTDSDNQWSYNVLFVIFDDFVFVAEAPISSEISEKVLQTIREVAPGKPVRYLVQSHHHGDHIGGIRTYIAEDTTILAGPSLISFIEKVAAAPFSLNPDRLFKEPKKPKIEAVKTFKKISDAHHEAMVYNIGPSPHATDMMIVYLPAEKILYQSDMVNEGEYPANDTTRDFWSKVKELKLNVKLLAGLHGQIKNLP